MSERGFLCQRTGTGTFHPQSGRKSKNRGTSGCSPDVDADAFGHRGIAGDDVHRGMVHGYGSTRTGRNPGVLPGSRGPPHSDLQVLWHGSGV